MPYKISWSETCVEWNYFGSITGNEIIDPITEIFGDPRFDNLRYQIADLTQIMRAEVDEREMKKAAYLDRAAAQSNPNIRVAIIASTEVSRLIGIQYIKNATNSPWECAMFATRAEAENWLHQTKPAPSNVAC